MCIEFDHIDLTPTSKNDSRHLVKHDSDFKPLEGECKSTFKTGANNGSDPRYPSGPTNPIDNCSMIPSGIQ